jgi:hypothetical protein
MNMDDSRLIARFQRLITEILIEKRLGQRRPELTDEFCQTWLEVEQRGLKKTPEYRNVLLRADRHALWLAGLVRLSSPECCATPLFKRNRGRRHTERFPRGGVTVEGDDRQNENPRRGLGNPPYMNCSLGNTAARRRSLRKLTR